MGEQKKKGILMFYLIMLFLIFSLSLMILALDKSSNIETQNQKIKDTCYNSQEVIEKLQNNTNNYHMLKTNMQDGKYKCTLVKVENQNNNIIQSKFNQS